MSISKAFGAAPFGLHARMISVETDISRGLYMLSIVGLADRAVDESRERVSSAIKNSGIPAPKTKNQKIVISLAPAYLKKEGSLFDLPIAISYLRAAGEIKSGTSNRLFVGELSLDGSIRPVRGIIPIIQEAQRRSLEEIFIPQDNMTEAKALSSIMPLKKIVFVSSLRETIDHLNGVRIIRNDTSDIEQDASRRDEDTFQDRSEGKTGSNPEIPDFKDIEGQTEAKRAIIIAVAGKHNIILHGPPGTSKSLLAKACMGIMPSLTAEQSMETAAIYSERSRGCRPMDMAPFRSPHHTASYSSIIGSSASYFGEITLAHNGILFLDELPEFDRRVIESLRQPLEEKTVNINRSQAGIQGGITLPANFFLIAAMNPCPCGFRGDGERKCTCMAHQINRYRKKLSGPLLDRIDLWAETRRVYIEMDTRKKYSEHKGLMTRNGGGAIDIGSTCDIKERIIRARAVQQKRFSEARLKIDANSQIPFNKINDICMIRQTGADLLNEACKRLSLSPRAFHRTIRVARTIADLDGSAHIEDAHVLEALSLRPRIEN